MRITLFLLLTGLVFWPVLCGPSPALAAHADEASVTHTVDPHAVDACGDQEQPPVTTGSPLVLAPPALAGVDLRLVPAGAMPLLGNAFTPHGAVQRRTPLRL
jgi:hypothetical protein